MNILFIDQFGSLGGAQFCLLDLLPAIAERGWSARAAIQGDGPFVQRLGAAGVPVDSLRENSYQSGTKSISDVARFAAAVPRSAAGLSALVQGHSIDLLYVNGPRLLPSAAWVARHGSIPLLFHCHVHLSQRSAARLAGWSLRWSRAAVISCCSYSVRPLRGYVPDERIHVIYNGIPEVPRSARSLDHGWRIGVVGRVERDKGQLEFIEAARILAPDFPDCRFQIVGKPLFSGPEYFKSVQRAAAGLPVDFPGWRDDIARIFADLDLLVVPSTYVDSTPRVIMEAFSARVPVVAFPSGGIPEIIEDDATGFLTRETTSEALAARIHDVLAMDIGRLEAVVARARAAWEQKYQVARFRQQVSGAIAQLVR